MYKRQVFPWIELGAGSSGELLPPVLAVLGLLTSGDGEQAQAVLLFQDGDDALTVAVVLEPSAVTFPLADLVMADPAITFTPLLPVTDLTTGEGTAVSGDPIALPASGELVIGWSPAPAGTYALMTTARDVWGNQSQVADTVEMQ